MNQYFFCMEIYYGELRSLTFKLSSLILMQHIQLDLCGSSYFHVTCFIIFYACFILVLTSFPLEAKKTKKATQNGGTRA